MKTRLLVLACGGLGALSWACGGGGTTTPGDADVGVTDIAYDQSQDLVADRPVQGTLKLDFVWDTGDDQTPCKGKQVCNLILSYNEERAIDVVLTRGTTPVPGEQITYTIMDDTKGLGQLAAMSAFTGQDGVAKNKIKNVKTDVGQFKVKVCAASYKDVPCLYFNIAVTPKGFAPLMVSFTDYKGHYFVNTVEVRIFKQDKTDGSGKPRCSDLNLESLPTATLVSQKMGLSDTVIFGELPNLEAEKLQYYTVLGLASDGDGPVKAWACDDTQGKVEWGKQTSVKLTLQDIPPRITGSYRVYNTFDLVSGLPENVRNVVYTIVGFFENPAAQIMLLICKAGGDTLDEFCGYLFNDKDNPDIKELTMAGDVVFQIINVVLVGLLEKYCPFEDKDMCSKIYWTGDDISKILTKFQLMATFTFPNEPDKDGKLVGCLEKWDTVRIRWTLGQDCPPDDEQCGWKNLPLGGPDLPDVISSQFEAQVVDFDKLTIAKHKLNFKYGALVNFAIERLLLPQVFGDGSDGLPAVDSYEDLIGSLLAGKECLIDNSCCDKFAEDVTDKTSGLTKNFVKGACEALIQTGSTYLRNQLTSLDTTPDNFEIGTAEPCPLYDKNNDMKIDAFGDKQNQCKWDVTLTVGSTNYKPDGTFYGIAK